MSACISAGGALVGSIRAAVAVGPAALVEPPQAVSVSRQSNSATSREGQKRFIGIASWCIRQLFSLVFNTLKRVVMGRRSLRASPEHHTSKCQRSRWILHWWQVSRCLPLVASLAGASSGFLSQVDTICQSFLCKYILRI